MSGQVLEISKHDNRTQGPAHPAAHTQVARLYTFPSHAPQVKAVPAPAAGPQAHPQTSPRTWRSRLAIELAIGFMVWLMWFWWHMLH